MGKIVNQGELAEILGVSKKSVSLWQREGLPVAIRATRGKESSYDTQEVITWYALRLVPDKGAGQESQKERLSRMQADRIEMQMAQTRGELVPAAEIEPAWAGLVISVRQAMLAIPSGLAPLLAQTDDIDEIRELLQETIEDALQKLSNEPSINETTPSNDGEIRSAVEDVAL